MTRAEARAATIATLVAAGVVPAGHVYPSRSAPLGNDELPGLVVYATRQLDKRRSVNVPMFARTLDLAVEVVVTADADDELDDELDARCAAVEVALLANDSWIGAFEVVEQVQTEIAYGVDAGRRRGAARLVFSVTYNVEHVLDAVANAAKLDKVHVVAGTLPPTSIDVTVPQDPP